MNQKVLYSMMGLAALPLGADAAIVQTAELKSWEGTGLEVTDALISSNGTKATYNIGKLNPGTYKLTCKLTSELYEVTVAIAGKEVKKTGINQSVEINFTLSAKDAKNDVILTFTSAGESTAIGAGAEFSFDAPVLSLDFDFATPKAKLTTNIDALISTIGGYGYAKEDDVNAAKAIKKKIDELKESYDDYDKYKLYSNPNALQEEINTLAAKAANSEAFYQVDLLVTAAKNRSHDAATTLEAQLVDVALYLLSDAQAELAAINDEINVINNANIASKNAGTSVADQSTHTADIYKIFKNDSSNEKLKAFEAKWIGQANANKSAYNALHAKVTNLQTKLDAVKIPASVASSYNKTEAQTAINAINTKIENIKNSATQLTFNVDADVTAAQKKIDDLNTKATNAGANTDAYNADKKTVADKQKELDDAKKVVNAKKYGSTSVEAQYTNYVAALQAQINTMGTTADNRFKAANKEVANSYVKVSVPADLSKNISDYKTNAVKAADYYAELQKAIAGYEKDLTAARKAFENLDIYKAEGYNYYGKLNILLKEINDLKAEIAATLEIKGKEHWEALLAIDKKAIIGTTIAAYMAEKDAKQLEYVNTTNNTSLADAVAALETAVAADYTEAVNGADYTVFNAEKAAIKAELDAIKAVKAGVNPDVPNIDYTSKVGTGKSNWLRGVTQSAGNYQVKAVGDNRPVEMIEVWAPNANQIGNGKVLYQTLSNLANGVYTLEIYAQANGGTQGLTDAISIYANNVSVPMTTKNDEVYTIKLDNVLVSDGTLEMGMMKHKEGTNWHLIQIKSMTATTASIISSLSAKATSLKAEQDALSKVATDAAAKVTANSTKQTDNANSIAGLETAIGNFETTYKLGADDTSLGLRGKSPNGSAYKAEAAIKTDLAKLKTDNAGVSVTTVDKVDNTSKVDESINGWVLGDFTHNGSQSRTTAKSGVTLVEQWAPASNAQREKTGNVLVQTLNNLPNGIYDIELYALAVDQASGYPNKDKKDIAYVYVNDVQEYMTVQGDADANIVAQEYTFKDVYVSDGTLVMGLSKAKAGTNWHAIQIKSLTRHDNALSVLDTHAATYTAIAKRQSDLEKKAVDIKKEVEANTALNTAATKAVTDLNDFELSTLKSLKNVTNADAVSDDATAKKTDPADFKVFETGLAAGMSYTDKKKAIDDDITALSAAIEASFKAETLTKDWQNNSISVVTGKDPKTQADITKTYSIATIKAAITALKNEAAAESDNYEAYKALQDNNMAKCLPDSIFEGLDEAGITAVTGAGAKKYYTDLKVSYITTKGKILEDMQKSLSGREAVAAKSGYETRIADLLAKVKVVFTDADNNRKKYLEQKADLEDVQKLMDEVYTHILATDNSTKRDGFLSQLDAIKKEITAAAGNNGKADTNGTVWTNFTTGVAVSKAVDFADIKARINDVKAQQSEGYDTAVAEDNAAAHATFNTAIALTNDAYNQAKTARQQYSSSNAAIADALYSAAETLDAAIAKCKTAIDKLTKAEGKDYAATVSPNIYSSTKYCDEAEDIASTITTAKTTYIDAVGAAISEFWSGKKSTYTSKVAAAESVIASYGAAARKNAFKDVKDLIAAGDAAVKAKNLADVESAVEALEDIDNLLATDKNNAANKDLQAEINKRNAKTDRANLVKDYGRFFEDYDSDAFDDAEQYVVEAKAERAASYADGTLVDNYTYIKNLLNAYTTEYNNIKSNAEARKKADTDNTAAYTDMVEALDSVEEKLAQANALIAQYKYPTSLATFEGGLATWMQNAEVLKNGGQAVSYKSWFLSGVAALSSNIENALRTTAFNTEKSGLNADITELKNLYNSYVAKNGVNATSAAFKTAIDKLEARLAAAEVVEVDKPADGIKFNDIVAATEKLIQLQKDIAKQQTTMGLDNASVLAALTSQISALEAKATLEGKAEWVLAQSYNGQTLEEWIEEMQNQISELKGEVEAEQNIAFYEDQYQEKVNDLDANLSDGLTQANTLQNLYEANEAAYATLTSTLDKLQQKLDAAKAKVEAYEFYQGDYSYINNAQNQIDNARYDVEYYYENIYAQNCYIAPYVNNANSSIQIYLDNSAYNELRLQGTRINNNLLSTNIAGGIYSQAARNRLVEVKSNIKKEIDNFWQKIDYSYQDHECEYVYDEGILYRYDKKDEDGNDIPKARTSDADYAAQIAMVQPIQDKIDNLSDAIQDMILLGDANESGYVDVLDYRLVANMILDPSRQPDPEESEHLSDLFHSIDVNGNEVIEVGDLTAIVNYILDKDWQGYAAAAGVKAEYSAEHLSMTASELPTGVQRFAVNLENITDYTAFQLDVVLPEGMSIVGMQLSDRAGESHQLMSRTQADGSVRLLASSIKGEVFGGNNGAVVYIDLKNDGSYKGGSVELVNVLFSSTNYGTRAFSLKGETTGISLTETLDSLKQKVYDLSGRLANGLKKGINIIRRADGSTQKVMK